MPYFVQKHGKEILVVSYTETLNRINKYHLKTFDAKSGSNIQELNLNEGIQSFITIERQNDFSLIFAGSDKGNITIYDAFDIRREIEGASITKLDSMCTVLALSQDNKYMSAGTRRGTIKIYEVEDLLDDVYLKNITIHGDKIIDIGFIT